VYSFKAEIADIQPVAKSELREYLRDYETWKHTVIESCFSVIHSKDIHGSLT
jgi:hypothetical protein